MFRGQPVANCNNCNARNRTRTVPQAAGKAERIRRDGSSLPTACVSGYRRLVPAFITHFALKRSSPLSRTTLVSGTSLMTSPSILGIGDGRVWLGVQIPGFLRTALGGG